jgi:hypothetical protein
VLCVIEFRQKLLILGMLKMSSTNTPEQASGPLNVPTAPACAIFQNESTFAEPFKRKGKRMARREYQKPNVQRSKGRKPYWYVRFRVREYDGQRRKWIRPEKWYRLGDCETMSKREVNENGISSWQP